MNKRCTNSKCRKVFHYTVGEVAVCPYCKKMYPRTINESQDCLIDNQKYSFKLLWSHEFIFEYLLTGNIRMCTQARIHIARMTCLNYENAKALLDFVKANKRVPLKVKLINGGIKVEESAPLDAIPRFRAFKDECEKKREKELGKYKNKNIDDLDLSVRSYNILKRNGVNTVSDIHQRKDELMNFRNMGRKSYEEIADRMSKMRLYLPEYKSRREQIAKPVASIITQEEMDELILEIDKVLDKKI